tara:strand:+ start:35 stop:424 length:390 start_codon:yes stop_codon:yes gene_type:complete
MNKVTIYTNKTCPYCKELTSYLSENNIEFESKIITEIKEEWSSIVGLTGMPNVPTVLFMGEYFVPGRDFRNKEHFINIINNYKKSKFSKEERTFENVKTLTYLTMTAFGKLDQLLRKIEGKLNTKENNE